MSIGYFDNNDIVSGMHVAILRLELKGVNAYYIDKLSYLASEKNDFGIDVLLVNTGLSHLGWHNLIEFVQKRPKMRIVLFLTTESARLFDESGIGRFSNVEFCYWDDRNGPGYDKKVDQLIVEAKGSV